MSRPKGWKITKEKVAKALNHPRLAGVRFNIQETFKTYDFRKNLGLKHETHEITVSGSNDRGILDAMDVLLHEAGFNAAERLHVFHISESRIITKQKKSTPRVKTHKFHDLPGLYITTPHVDVFKVQDNNGNWLIERPLFRWGRVNREHAESEAKMLNLGYQHALYDLIAGRPEALAILTKLKGEMKSVEKQVKGVKF